MPGGRPSTYTDEVADAICQSVSAGKSLRETLKAEGMPTRSCVYVWMEKYPEFKDRLARAQQDCADWFADQAYKAALSAVDKDSAAAARVQTATYLALARVHDPRRYGDQSRLEVEHSGTVNTGMSVVVRVLPAVPPQAQAIDVEPDCAALPDSSATPGIE